MRVNQATHPELAQHVINQEPIMPAAGYLEMVGSLNRPFYYCVLMQQHRSSKPVLAPFKMYNSAPYSPFFFYRRAQKEDPPGIEGTRGSCRIIQAAQRKLTNLSLGDMESVVEFDNTNRNKVGVELAHRSIN